MWIITGIMCYGSLIAGVAYAIYMLQEDFKDE